MKNGLDQSTNSINSLPLAATAGVEGRPPFEHEVRKESIEVEEFDTLLDVFRTLLKWSEEEERNKT